MMLYKLLIYYEIVLLKFMFSFNVPDELLVLALGPEEPFGADAPLNFGTGGFRWAGVLFSEV